MKLMCVHHSLSITIPIHDWIIPRTSHFIPLLVASSPDFDHNMRGIADGADDSGNFM